MSLPLIEKYRPRNFDEVVGVEDIDRLQSLIKEPMDMPNLMFYGPQGTGKTTVAKIIIDELKPVDYLRINGSDTTGVDTIRNKVRSFVSSMSSSEGKPKLVWIEEFDFMSDNAFAALRALIEDYMANARFLVTLNYLSKIPEPIRSRFTLFEFNKPSVDDMADRATLICDEEGITYDSGCVSSICEKCNGDIRATLNTIQRLSSNEDKHISSDDVASTKPLAERVYELLNNGLWSKIRYDIPKENPDYYKLLEELDEKFFNSDLSIDKKAEVNEIIARGFFEMKDSFNPHICFGAIASKIIKAVRKDEV